MKTICIFTEVFSTNKFRSEKVSGCLLVREPQRIKSTRNRNEPLVGSSLQKFPKGYKKTPWSSSKGEKSKRVSSVVKRVASKPPLWNELVGHVEVVPVVGDHHACGHHLRSAWDLVTSKDHIHLHQPKY